MSLGSGHLFMISVTGPRTAVTTCYSSEILSMCVCVCISAKESKVFILGPATLGLIMRQTKDVQAH